MKAIITLEYDLESEKHCLDVQSEIVNYANKGLKVMKVEVNYDDRP